MLAEKLKIGDTIGVIAPDKAVLSSDKVYMDKAKEFFESLGLKVKYGKYLYSDENYTAGTPKERAEDINEMFKDKNVKAIICVKGGDIVNGVLPYIDYDMIKNNPKIFLGMSDNTILLCAIEKMTGLITFHCNDYISFGKEEVEEYAKNEIIDKLFNGNKTIIPYTKREFTNFNNKEIVGKLYGTNIIALLNLVGTPYMPDLKDKILFFEDFHSNIIEYNYMLEHYNQMNVLNKAVVFGYIYGLQYVYKNKDDVVEELRKINPTIPVVKTEDFGHRHSNSIIPIGVTVKLNPRDKSIIIIDDYLK